MKKKKKKISSVGSWTSIDMVWFYNNCKYVIWLQIITVRILVSGDSNEAVLRLT